MGGGKGVKKEFNFCFKHFKTIIGKEFNIEEWKFRIKNHVTTSPT